LAYVLFALMQKVRKKSRPKNASTHFPTHTSGLGRAYARLHINVLTLLYDEMLEGKSIKYKYVDGIKIN
jgi:hypothetical protein